MFFFSLFLSDKSAIFWIVTILLPIVSFFQSLWDYCQRSVYDSYHCYLHIQWIFQHSSMFQVYAPVFLSFIFAFWSVRTAETLINFISFWWLQLGLIFQPEFSDWLYLKIFLMIECLILQSGSWFLLAPFLFIIKVLLLV